MRSLFPILSFILVTANSPSFAADDATKHSISQQTENLVNETVGEASNDPGCQFTLTSVQPPLTKPLNFSVLSNGLTVKEYVDSLLEPTVPRSLEQEREDHLRSSEGVGRMMDSHIAAAGELLDGVVYNLKPDSPQVQAANSLGTSYQSLMKIVRNVQTGPMGKIGRFLEATAGNGTANILSRFISNESALRELINGMRSSKTVLLDDNIRALRYQTYINELARALADYGQEQAAVLAEIRTRKSAGNENPRIALAESKLVVILSRIEQLRMTYNATTSSLTALIEANRQEIENVEQAEQVTLPALTSGIALKSALSRQRQVIQNRRLLESTTVKLLQDVQTMLKDQSDMINEDAVNVVKRMQDLQKILEGITTTINTNRQARLAQTPQLERAVKELARMNDRNEIAAKNVSLDVTFLPSAKR